MGCGEHSVGADPKDQGASGTRSSRADKRWSKDLRGGGDASGARRRMERTTQAGAGPLPRQASLVTRWLLVGPEPSGTSGRRPAPEALCFILLLKLP